MQSLLTGLRSLRSVGPALQYPCDRNRLSHWTVPDTQTGVSVCLATDGTYLYVASKGTLAKVGTGDGSSSPSVVYARGKLEAQPADTCVPSAWLPGV